MNRYRLTVEFDGRNFMGWQRQKHGATIQGSIEEAGASIAGQPTPVQAAGRTDAGVHGLAMTAHIDVARDFTPFRLMEALNARLKPRPIAILSCEQVDPEWHARFSCIGRRYLYRIINRRPPLTLEAGRAWHVIKPLDAETMDIAAKRLIGLHDFTTFRSVHCQSKSPVKPLDPLDVRRIGDQIEITAAARSFLHHQVRSMVGCLVLVGQGQWTADDMTTALEARNRAALGFNAPPDGLYFTQAIY